MCLYSIADVRSVSSSFCPSLASLASPEPEVKYPRGIINPNYPGFQHLAHTLAEHFLDHQFEQSDSDVSEFEVELKASPLDSDNGNVINSDLDKIEEILKGVFKSKESPVVETSVKFDSEVFSHNDRNKMNDRKCDVTKTSVDSASKNASGVIFSDAKRMYTTPDILIKSNSCEEGVDFAELNEKPDILKNVFSSEMDASDRVVGNEKFEENFELNDKCEQGQWSITPIDIVGDFEQEVEREFGLIVSGYKSSSSDDEMCVSVKSEVVEICHDNTTTSMYEKVSSKPFFFFIFLRLLRYEPCEPKNPFSHRLNLSQKLSAILMLKLFSHVVYPLPEHTNGVHQIYAFNEPILLC